MNSGIWEFRSFLSKFERYFIYLHFFNCHSLNFSLFSFYNRTFYNIFIIFVKFEYLLKIKFMYNEFLFELFSQI